MQALLMNFGDNTRVVHNIKKIPVIINIGQTEKVELDDATAQHLKKATPVDTLIMVPLSAEMPPALSELLAILQDLDQTEYSAILERTNVMIGPDNVPGLRPSRALIRSTLRDIALVWSQNPAQSLEGVVAAITAERERKRIQDDVDPADLAREQREAEERDQPTAPPAPKPTKREALDKSLGLMLTDVLGAPLEASKPNADPEPVMTRAQSRAAKKAEKEAKAAFKPKAVKRIKV